MKKSVARMGLCIAGLACVLALSACDDIGEALGMSRSSPDDGGKVATNPPLSLPPNYDLKPPRETPKGSEPDNGTPSTDPSIHHLQ